MKSKTFIMTAALSCAALWTIPALSLAEQTTATATAAPSAAASGERPNVIILYADDLGYGDLSCYGATKIHTPNIDKIAAEGLRFTNGHCATATCTPSRFAILTGKYAFRQKGTNILPGNAALIIPTDRTTLGKVFQNAGYHTAAVGKWHVGLGPQGGPDWNGIVKPGPNEVGFDYSFIFPATADRVPTIYVQNHNVVALDPKDPIQVDYDKKVGHDFTGKENPELLKMTANNTHDGTIVNGIGRLGWMSGGKMARWTDESLSCDFTNEAEKFIEANQDHPFFLYFAEPNIHVPRMPDTRFKGKSGLGYRGDSILELDYSVGRILTKLDQLGLSKNTLVLFTSDNGPVLNDSYNDGAVTMLNGHTPWGPMRGGKYSILEAGTRVPFIVRWPGHVTPGKSDALMTQVDLTATFAALTGQKLQKPDAPDSQNMLDALLGKSQTGRDSLVEQAHTLALVKGNLKYIKPHKGTALLKSTNIESGYTLKPQLYDLSTDIAEKHNLAAERPEVTNQMAQELEKIRTRK